MTRINSARRVPSRRWYALAAAIAVFGLFVSAALFALGIRSWIGDFPALGRHFGNGESVQVDLRAGQPVVLYASPDTARLDGQCTAELAGAKVAVTRVRYMFTFFSGGRSWAAQYEIRADRDGQARLTCIEAVGTGGLVMAVGDKPDNPRLVRTLFTTIAVSAAVAVSGLVLGGVLAMVVARRRRAHRSRPDQHPVHDTR